MSIGSFQEQEIYEFEFMPNNMKTEVKPRLGLAVRVKIKDEIKKGLRIFH
jgi:hypothetical protein